MGILNKTLAEKHKKLKEVPVGSVSNALSVSTGFHLIDYYCATIYEDKNGDECLNLGLPFGKIMLFAGNSQGGKTTMTQQIAVNMTKPYNGDVVLLDYERSSTNLAMRFRQISGIDKEEFNELVSVYNHTSMSTEFLKELIFEIVEIKKKLTKNDMIDWTDVNGNPIKIYPPTVLILDSIPAMKPKDVLEDASLDNNMVAGRMAAANSALVKSITALLETYNITILAINHITTKISTTMYGPRKVQIPGLDDSENLPGGNGFIYNASYIFKFTSGAELKAEKTYTNGRYTDFRILKTRTGFNNTRLKFVLDAKEGFSNAFTLMEYAKEEKLFTGSVGRYKFDGLEGTVTQKEFSKRFRSDDDFREKFLAAIEDSLISVVSDKYEDIEEESQVDSYNDLDDEFDDE